MAGSGTVQTAQNIHQRGLAGAGCPGQGDELPFLDVQSDALEHRKVYFSKVVHLSYVT